jgi:hypothetical protein
MWASFAPGFFFFAFVCRELSMLLSPAHFQLRASRLSEAGKNEP